jgi:crotonobetainyl-CoA:carnitine CoA-transferase CaiB-like acyl-CoA transferase
MRVGTDPAAGPLTGIRVLDLSRFIAGPLCCQLLGDMGAEVVKVERPGGEDARKHAPYYRDESIYTMVYNRNKYGITLDTRHPRAPGILAELIARSDLVVENYRPGTMAAMGLSYPEMRRIRRDVILVSISGYGQTGPLASRALFDAIAQATSGLMSVTGEAAGPPTLTGTYLADYIAGYHGMIGALLALLHRQRTGEGQHVDVASQDALFTTLGTRAAAYAMLGERPVRTGSRDLLNAPANVFPASDGHVYLHAGTNGLFPRLCAAMGAPALAADERYRDVDGRRAHVAELESVVAAWTRRRTRAELTEALAAVGVPCGEVADVPSVVDSPQIAAREMMLDIEHPTLGTLRLPGMPIKLDRSPGTVRKAPPTVGEDNDLVYRELLGLSDDELRKLRADGAI